MTAQHMTACLSHFSNLLITLSSTLFSPADLFPLWGRQRPLLFLVFSLHLLPAWWMRAARPIRLFAAFPGFSLQPCRVRSVRSLSAAAAWGKRVVWGTQLKPGSRRRCSLSTSRYPSVWGTNDFFDFRWSFVFMLREPSLEYSILTCSSWRRQREAKAHFIVSLFLFYCIWIKQVYFRWL